MKLMKFKNEFEAAQVAALYGTAVAVKSGFGWWFVADLPASRESAGSRLMENGEMISV